MWFHRALVLVIVVCLGAVPTGMVAAQPMTPATAGGIAQASERISLDLKGVDILDVLKLLSQKSGMNFVAGRNVSGRVTIFVNDVDVWKAFELIVSANDLAYERRDNIITVMMARDYELLYGQKFQERTQNLVLSLRYIKAAQVATILNQLKSSVGRVVTDEVTNTIILTDIPSQLEKMQAMLKDLDRPTETRVYALNYAEAEKFKDKIQDFLSPIGNFAFDARTNQAIVTDLRESLQKIDRVVRALDKPEGQVLIDARIISVTLNDNNSLGIDWQAVLGGNDSATRTNFISRDVVTGSVLLGASQGLAFQITPSKTNVSSVIEALQTIGKTETLSNPRIMVSNNQEAKILVGTKEAFVTSTTTVPATGSTTVAPQIQFQDVGTKLYVTPNIKADGRIRMKIRPEVSSVARTITSVQNTVIPIVQTTEVETFVLVKSGITLIIAGLIDNKDEESHNRVPGLGNIPFIGAAFRGKVIKKKKSELVVLLTPQIIMADGTPFIPTPEAASVGTDLLPEIVLQDPVSATYRHAIRQRLQAQLINQFKSAQLPQGSVVVSFVLDHTGALIGEPEVTSPQGEPFIAAARAALQAAQPFPGFPEGSLASEVRFRLPIEYQPQ